MHGAARTQDFRSNHGKSADIDLEPGAPQPARARSPDELGIEVLVGEEHAALRRGLDGKRLDVTPILGRAVPAGRHTLRAVLGDGRARTLDIEITAGRAAKPIVLTW